MTKLIDFSSLRARLLLLMLVAILPWVIAMSYQLWKARQHAVDDAVDDAMILARSLASSQSEAVSNARSLVQVLASLPEIRAGTPALCRLRLSQIYRQGGDYANLLVTDAKGNVLCTARGQDVSNVSDRDWFRLAVQHKQFVTARFVVGKIRGVPILPTAQPVLDADGNVQRVILAAIDVAWLERLLSQTRIATHAVVTVLDRKAVVLARLPSDPSMIGRTVALLPLHQAIAQGALEGHGESQDAGRAMLFAYARLPGETRADSNVYVSVSVPKDTVVATAYRNFSVNLGLLGALTVLVLMGAWIFTESLVLRKVRALIVGAGRIAGGDFKARAALLDNGKGELGELAKAFDEMAESIEQHFQQTLGVMEVAPEAIIISDAQGRIVRANARTQALFGYSAGELVGASLAALVPDNGRVPAPEYSAASGCDSPGKIVGSELFARRKDGSEFPAYISLGTLNTAHGALKISAIRDVSDRKQFEAQIIHQATHDALTDLPNRALFRELLISAMLQAERVEKLIAVIFLDLDGFKNINDTLGHEAGDALLNEIARRLVTTLRKGDVVARQGGDEFTILLQGINVYQDIVQIAEKILNIVAEAVVYEDHDMHITASMGITIYPFDDVEAENLLRNADTAMYQAKQAGKNNFRFYTAEMNTAIRERMEIERGLRRALQENQFELRYQPQAGIADLNMVGMEVLIRWNHPELGLISPARFIPIAEECGLIVPIGEWVLRTACHQISQWRKQGLPALKVSVNLSARQFKQAKLLDTIKDVLRECELTHHAEVLELELTESMVMQNVDDHVVTLNKLHAMGVQISIDDFGTGYSSLSYLKRFPINTLKIDRSFVRDITEDPDDAAIASAIIMLGHSLKLNVIAEGVETLEQLNLLREIGCDEIQGYYLSQPLTQADMETFLRRTLVATAKHA